jgi:hypothetical protein
MYLLTQDKRVIRSCEANVVTGSGTTYKIEEKPYNNCMRLFGTRQPTIDKTEMHLKFLAPEKEHPSDHLYTEKARGEKYLLDSNSIELDQNIFGTLVLAADDITKLPIPATREGIRSSPVKKITCPSYKELEIVKIELG